MIEIIRPECNENILINLENYRINMYKCKKNQVYHAIHQRK